MVLVAGKTARKAGAEESLNFPKYIFALKTFRDMVE